MLLIKFWIHILVHCRQNQDIGFWKSHGPRAEWTKEKKKYSKVLLMNQTYLPWLMHQNTKYFCKMHILLVFFSSCHLLPQTSAAALDSIFHYSFHFSRTYCSLNSNSKGIAPMFSESRALSKTNEETHLSFRPNGRYQQCHGSSSKLCALSETPKPRSDLSGHPSPRQSHHRFTRILVQKLLYILYYPLFFPL